MKRMPGRQIYTNKRKLYPDTNTLVPSRVLEAIEKAVDDEAAANGHKSSPVGPTLLLRDKIKIYTCPQQNSYMKLKFHPRLKEVYMSVKYICL